MEGIISNYRQGRHHQKNNQMIVLVDSVTDRESARKMNGQRVIWKNDIGKKIEIYGKVTNVHGNKGALRVHFEKGMPGQSVGTKVKIEA
jgi:large subunit ribosomal protein L35Ae